MSKPEFKWTGTVISYLPLNHLKTVEILSLHPNTTWPKDSYYNVVFDDYKACIPTSAIVEHPVLEYPPLYEQYEPLKTCSHDWAMYDSGWSRYEYCKTCNKKKDDK